MRLVRLRSLLLGLLIKLLIQPFIRISKKVQKQIEQESEQLVQASSAKLALRFSTNLKNNGVKALSEANLGSTYFSKLSRQKIEVVQLAAKG